eukprot:TRINITY_DN6760_c0_g1_i1.p1 TRINITY_DN6760_c0_g1~~TRINITY_DN6760_c0_g1_i1.p1  ORF type:complete len:448 (-),score=88.71 TRINITY_DN6760_c0_g1_i1:162-1397(-)
MEVKETPAQILPKVSRYRAGKVPEFAERELAADEENAVVPLVAPRERDRVSRLEDRVASFGIAEVLVQGEEEIDDDERRHREEVRQRLAREKFSVPVIVSHADDDDEEGEAEEEHDRRRQRLRERARQREEAERAARTEEEAVSSDEEGESSESEDSSEYETDSEDDEFTHRPHVAPVFKRKTERDTLSEQAKLEDEARQEEQERKRRLEEKKLETKQILRQEVRKNQEEENGPNPEPENDDDDEENEQEEYEKWKIRELARIKREQKEREDVDKAAQELIRRRNMTDAEIQREDAEFLKPRQKEKWKFLQKYYHKGAFFRSFDENDAIENKWDFSQPTLEDKADKSALPKVMQVKNFGRSGRTKYTHLMDQDTTKADSYWGQNDHIRAKFRAKMAGTGSVEVSHKKQKTY